MRKFLICFFCLALLLLVPAIAETYSFADVHVTLDLPDGVYDTVLTQNNLAMNAAWLTAQGRDPDAVRSAFEAEGILMEALDTKNGRRLVVTALKDVDAQTYFDLNNQDDDMRREYRVSHTNGSAYGILGYSYSSAKWTNYGGDKLRFLQTKYSLFQEGRQVCTGYQRRTIRNGYTLTLDMQVTGRAAKSADETALEKVMKGLSFSQILPMPELPLKLSLTATPPAETNEDTFTVKGTTGKNATVTATVFSLGATGSQTFTETASASGAFVLKVKLPKQGVYSVTLTSELTGAIAARRLFTVTYQKGLLSVDLGAVPGSELGDETVISGSTISGAKTQVSVSGPGGNYTKSTTRKDFKFELDTSQEGEYTFVLTVTKKGLDERSYTYKSTRTFNDVERIEKVKKSAKKITYANLQKTANEGKVVKYTGYITSVEQRMADEWVITFALRKSGDTYKDIIYVIAKEQPINGVGDKATLYGRASGAYSVVKEDEALHNYPRIEAYFFETAE